MLALWRTITWPHLVRAPLRSALIVFGVALGVATLVSMLAVNHSILAAFAESMERVGGKAELVVSNGEAGVDEQLVEALARLEGIAHAAGSLEITALRPGRPDGPLLVLGIDFLGDPYFTPLKATAGADAIDDPLSVINDPRAVLISNAMAQAERLSIGEPLTLLTAAGEQSLVVRGILDDQGQAAAFGGQVAVMFLDAAALAFGRTGRVDRIELSLQPGADRSATQARIEALLAGRARVEEPSGRTRRIQAMFDPITRSLVISGWVALLLSMFLIYNAVGVAVAERRREIGILRALGARRVQVVQLFCFEALGLALLGSLIGLLLGKALAALALLHTAPVVSALYLPIRPPAAQLSLSIAMAGLSLGLIATLISAWGPARGAASIDPREAMGAINQGAPRPLPTRALLLLGAVLIAVGLATTRLVNDLAGYLAMGLILGGASLAIPALTLAVHRATRAGFELIFGAAGRAGIDGAQRSLRRSAVAISALTLAVATSVSLWSWADSMEVSMMAWLSASLPADGFITDGTPIANQHNVPFSPKVLASVAEVAGVESVSALRNARIEVGDKRLQIIALDLGRTFEQQEKSGRSMIVVAGELDRRRLIEQPSVLIGESTARSLKLAPGDSLALETPSGRKSFRVEAVIVDYSSTQGTLLMDRRWYLAFWQDPLVDTVYVFTTPGLPVEPVLGAIRQRLGGGASLYVLSAASLRAEFQQLLSEALSIFHSVDFLALWVAMLGIVGTMLAAILDRRRELAVLRAIGASRRQIVLLVVAESSFLGLCAVIGGLLTAIPMGWVLVRIIGLVNTGWTIAYQYSITGALRVSAAVLLTALLAGLIPGRRAARADLASALTG